MDAMPVPGFLGLMTPPCFALVRVEESSGNGRSSGGNFGEHNGDLVMHCKCWVFHSQVSKMLVVFNGTFNENGPISGNHPYKS